MTPRPSDPRPAGRWRPRTRAGWESALVPMVSLVLAASLLAGCGGGGGSAVTPPPQPAPQGALTASAPGELVAFVKAKLEAREVQRRANPGIVFGDTAGGPIWLSTFTTAAGTAERSGTTVQESGVDEDDLIKSDGNLIATLSPERGAGGGNTYATLQLYRPAAAGASRPEALGRVALPAPGNAWAVTHGMYLASEPQRVAVVAETSSGVIGIPECREGEACITLLPYPWYTKSRVQLQLVDIANPAQASLRDELQIDGRLVGSRQVGRMLYLVTTHSPQFDFEALPATATAAEKAAALARLSAADFLPKWARNGAVAQTMFAETQCYTQPGNASLDLTVTTISAIDLGSPTLAATHRCFVGGSEALYMSPASLYLATTRHEVQTMNNRLIFPAEMRTDIHKFAIAGAQIDYRGSGQIAGHLGWDREKAPYRMSEHAGHLRVISFTGQFGWLTPDDAAARATAPSPATLTVLRENTTTRALDTVATLPNAQRPAAIGLPGEQVYAVRFLGDRGYVVTFRQVDPLYVLDLSNPADPRVAGELKMPGFSDYLYPLANGKMFGVGKDADDDGRLRGLKVALFDVSDAATPRLLQSITLGQAGSHSGLDSSRHAISLFERNAVTRIALPVVLTSADYRVAETGLQRFEVDTAAGTLRTKSLVPSAMSIWGWHDLSADRSLHIGDQLYYLSQGTLGVTDW